MARATQRLGFSELDEQKFGVFHWRTMLTTGLGVFCDGYDLSSLALVQSLVLHSFGAPPLTGILSAAVTASALVGAAAGAILFGLLGQKGRKRFYGVDVAILGTAALLQAAAPNLTSLIIIRFVLGIGIGADYVLSPVILSEHVNRGNRGMALALGFGVMWNLGALSVALFKLLLDGIGLPDDLQWRIVLAAGAIPAFSVLYFRRRMPETARYLARLAGDSAQAAKVITEISGVSSTAPGRDERSFGEAFRIHAPTIFSVALLWMMFDLLKYPGTLFGPSLLAPRMGLTSELFALRLQLLVIPAQILCAVFLIDTVGRKPLQIAGFLLSALLIGILALAEDLWHVMPSTAFVLYVLFCIAGIGPGLVSGSGVLGVELAPTRIRAVAQSIAVAGGRTGGALSAFAFPVLFGSVGPFATFSGLAATAVLGAILTYVLVPETRRSSLEAITERF